MEDRTILDFETRSQADLKKVGAYLYSLHPTTRPTCMAYKRRGNKRDVVLLPFEYFSVLWGQLPEAFRTDWVDISQYHLIYAHNAFFERCIYHNILVKRLGWPEIKPHQWRCTAAKAATCALPRSLEGAGAALGLTIQKDKGGMIAMMRTCRPTKEWNAWKKNEGKWRVSSRDAWKEIEPLEMFISPESHPQVFRDLYHYCKVDVLAEEKLDEQVPDLTGSELRVWQLNQRMNWRGFRVDMPLIRKILTIMETEDKKSLRKLDETTMGLITKPGQRARILEFLALEGIDLPDIRANTVQDALEGDKLSAVGRQLLELRKILSKTSTKKYLGFTLRGHEADHRVRDISMYHGASTGRDTGTGIQIQNFPRPVIPIDRDRPYAPVENIQDCDGETLKLLYGENLSLLFSSVLRNMILASPGMELFVADLNKIEVAVGWWITENTPGIRILKRGGDPYKRLAAINTGLAYEDIDDDGEERQLAKHQILGCLAVGTLVGTKSGVKKIEDIETSDEVWDGELWQRHGGLAHQGLKNVIQIGSLQLTPDHWVLVDSVWRSALEVYFHHQEWVSTMEDSRLPKLYLKKGLSGVSVCAAYVELRKNFVWINSGEERIFCAHLALELGMPQLAGGVEETVTSSLIRNLESVGKYVSTISGVDARTLVIRTTEGMAVAASDATSHLCARFWNTLLRCAGLTSGESAWTELITTGIMSPETYELRLSEFPTKTVHTYDIRDAGPGKRFQAGNFIVHNCQYGMGWEKFQRTGWDLHRLRLTDVQSKAAVRQYRDTFPRVTGFWRLIERMAIAAVRDPGRAKVFFGGRARFVFADRYLWMVLPSGRRIAYRDPQTKMRVSEYTGDEQETLEFWAVNPRTKKWNAERTWGGVLMENMVQGIARDLLMFALPRLRDLNYEILFTVHDEIVAERERGLGNLEEFIRVICEKPAWADENLYLEAKGYSNVRYRK